MRTPRLFLGVFALTLLLPLLVLACGGSDEPKDGPSSERSIDEPEGRASSGQITAAPTRQRVSPMSTLQPTAVPTLAQTPPETDREALVALYNATDGPNWRRDNTNWLSDAPISEWRSVSTDSDGRVVTLHLHFVGLKGELPPELGILSELRSLQLGENGLTGEIPPELGNLTNLETLQLEGNLLSGRIPPELGNLANLKVLALGDLYSGNRLSGEIPPALGNLVNLEVLHIDGNQLSGAIPPELGNLTGLKSLSLRWNRLTGEIPPELSNLTNLERLSLQGNQLSGEIPLELGDLTGLKSLSLDGNQLSGEIPPKLGNLTGLKSLALQGNQLSGEIPPELGNMAVYLHGNQLEVPATNDVDRAVLTTLYNATDGENWDAHRNWLSDEHVFQWHGIAVGSDGRVTGLYLSANSLNGEIPSDLGNLTSLRVLYLSTNGLSGEIPSDLGNLTSLRALDLTLNDFQGEIPPELGNLVNLQSLWIFDNRLSGCVPTSLRGQLETSTGLGALPFC